MILQFSINNIFTLSMIIKIILTVLAGYIAVNSVFKFHFTINRIILLYLITLYFIGFVFYDLDKSLALLITFSVDSLIFLGLAIFFYTKKTFGYVLLNSYKRIDYLENKPVIDNISLEYNLKPENICYNSKKPFLVVFKGINYKQAKEIKTKLDQFYSKTQKRLTMISYWHIVVFLILTVIVWRF